MSLWGLPRYDVNCASAYVSQNLEFVSVQFFDAMGCLVQAESGCYYVIVLPLPFVLQPQTDSSSLNGKCVSSPWSGLQPPLRSLLAKPWIAMLAHQVACNITSPQIQDA